MASPTPQQLPDSSQRLAVLLGPPGSGKGTQCARLGGLLGFAHISIGDALRREARNGTGSGRPVSSYLRAGMLVPDDVVLDVLLVELERQSQAPGLLLDGFPRTVAQAEELDRLHGAVRLAISLVVPRRVLLWRLAARGRDDDGAATVRRRLVSYERETRPLLDWYAERGALVTVDGNRAPGEVAMVVAGFLRQAGVGCSGS